MSIRSFIAIPVSGDPANALGDCSARMAYQDKSNAVRWVDQSNFHITLAFLGDQDERALEEVAERLDENLPQSGFAVAVTHLSPFPESRPKLIAALIEKTKELTELQNLVLGALTTSAIDFDKRKFLPHITLGRYRHSRNVFAGRIPTNLDLVLDINEVVLYQSNLTPNGAEYAALFRLPMAEFDYFET